MIGGKNIATIHEFDLLSGASPLRIVKFTNSWVKSLKGKRGLRHASQQENGGKGNSAWPKSNEFEQ
ncbi:hypothetical protein CA13_31980 [Planctomycetes bacterium CA13]|uniref:Uncharacterized protein n=1 Tax=Novipirellula herctigrandis TaxID=2527986 RepID=A0A5C5Z3G6_9BACT|nr:hypothetical protein CA13_31980 [Planctomycetes bacterium CA13]